MDAPGFREVMQLVRDLTKDPRDGATWGAVIDALLALTQKADQGRAYTSLASDAFILGMRYAGKGPAETRDALKKVRPAWDILGVYPGMDTGGDKRQGAARVSQRLIDLKEKGVDVPPI